MSKQTSGEERRPTYVDVLGLSGLVVGQRRISSPAVLERSGQGQTTVFTITGTPKWRKCSSSLQ